MQSNQHPSSQHQQKAAMQQQQMQQQQKLRVSSTGSNGRKMKSANDYSAFYSQQQTNQHLQHTPQQSSQYQPQESKQMRQSNKMVIENNNSQQQKQQRSNRDGSGGSSSSNQKQYQFQTSKKGNTQAQAEGFNPMTLLMQSQNISARESQQLQQSSAKRSSRRQTAKSNNFSIPQSELYSANNNFTNAANAQLHFSAVSQNITGRSSQDPAAMKQLAIQQNQKGHHQRGGKFTGSFLATHNSKTKAAAAGEPRQRVKANFSVSPKVQGQVSHGGQGGQVQQPMLTKQNLGGAPTHGKIAMSKSPIAVSNPSTFTITNTTQVMFNSSQPSPSNTQNSQQTVKRQSFQGPAGSNPSSVKNNSTKQTVMSDILNATDHSTIKQRENIKVFSFKPGNLKIQPKQLNVQSLKTSQISLNNKHHQHDRVNSSSNNAASTSSGLIFHQQPTKAAGAKTRVPTTAAPSPKSGCFANGVNSSKLVLTTKARNRSSGNTGKNSESGQQQASATIFVQKKKSSGTNNMKGQDNFTTAIAPRYHSNGSSGNDGISNESRPHVAINTQPNLVKKSLMTTGGRSREDSTEAYNTPDTALINKKQSYHAYKQSLQQKKFQDPNQKQQCQQKQASNASQLVTTNKRVNSASSRQVQQKTVKQTITIPVDDSSPEGGCQVSVTSTVKKIKIKKSRRGHSENTDTDASKQRTSSLVFQNSNIIQKDQQSTSTATAANTQQKVLKTYKVRGNSMPQQSIHEVNEKLQVYKMQQQKIAEQCTAATDQPKAAIDHKEIIVNHIRKYIKVGGKMVGAEDRKDSPEVIIQNLRDFLTYLENKNIINPKKLSDQSEMKNLIKDIMKLDLSKFSKPRRTNSQPNHNRQSYHKKTSSSSQQKLAESSQQIQTKKPRRAMPSPAHGENGITAQNNNYSNTAYTEAANGQQQSKSIPTQVSAPTATNSSQKSIPDFARVKMQLAAAVNTNQNGQQINNSRAIEHHYSRTKNTSVETINSLIHNQNQNSSSLKIIKNPSVQHQPVAQHDQQQQQYEYASQPKYLNYGLLAPHQQQKLLKSGLKTTGNRSRDNSGNSRKSPFKKLQQNTNTTETKINMSSINFVLPSQSNRNQHKNNKNISYNGIKTNDNTVQSSAIQTSRNSSQEQQNISVEQEGAAGYHQSSKTTSRTNKSVGGVKIQSKEVNLVHQQKPQQYRQQQKMQEPSPPNCDIAVEQQLQKFKISYQKPRLQSGRNSKTAVPSTQHSPRGGFLQQKNMLLNSGNGGEQQSQQQQVVDADVSPYQKQMVASQPHLKQVPSSDPQQPQQQIPTIQLMINTNGQGKFLGINVNNYCFAPPAEQQQIAAPQSAAENNTLQQSNNNNRQQTAEVRQLQQMIQMQNNSAEQLTRVQKSGGLKQSSIIDGGKKAQQYHNIVKTEPDHHQNTLRTTNSNKNAIDKDKAAELQDQTAAFGGFNNQQRQPNNYQRQQQQQNLLTKSNNQSSNIIMKDFMKQQLKLSSEKSSSHSNNSDQFNHNNNSSYQMRLLQSKMIDNNAGSSSEFEICGGIRAGSNKKQNQQHGSGSGSHLMNHQQQVMVIQDEDDEMDNTGGNGAEAKMSPSSHNQIFNNMGISSRSSHFLQQNNSGGFQQQQQETPIVQKQMQQQRQQQNNLQKSASNRGESGSGSNKRNSSLSKALELNKGQIKVDFGVGGGPRRQTQKQTSSIQQPKLQSKESLEREKQFLLSKLKELNRKGIENQNVNQQDILRQPQSKVNSTPTPTAPTTAQNSPVVQKQNVVLNDYSVTEDREKLIKYVKSYVNKHGKIPHTTLDFYRFVKLLGKGAFGKITLGIHKLTGKYVAIKSIDKVNIKDEYSRRKVFQEVYILKKIRHSCVIRLLEVFESEKHFLMVMEYSGGGDLLQYVKKRRRLNEQSAKAIFKQILYALGHCHCRSVLHRDIKLDNVLMDGEGGVKLCDFGVSRMVKKGQTINEQCGTPAYLAPEIITDTGYQGFAADVWSLGVLLYAMVQGTVPFKANNITDLHKLILKGEFDFPVDSVSVEVKDLIRKMLILDPMNRISIPSMLNHPWVYDMSRDLGGEPGNLEDEEHDLRVGSTFFREEVLGGLISGYKSDGNENGNINFVNVENLYYRGGPPQKEPQTNPAEKVTYSDYCALTEDFMTYRINEDAMEIVTGFGYPRQQVIQSINRGDVNHATAAYYLLVY